MLRSARQQNLFLNSSLLPQGLRADRLEARGGVFLRGVEAHGVVRLPGAKLGGDLSCVGAKFNAGRGADGKPKGYAFMADRLNTKGSVFLSRVEAQGEVRLSGAKLGGDLDCAGAKFNAAQGGNGYALMAERIEAKGAFFLRAGARINGKVALTAAQVGALYDEAECWPRHKGEIEIDRFRYGAILGANPMPVHARIQWLAKTHTKGAFSPLPYEQLAKVLRESGHREDARTVLIEKERLQRQARRKRLRDTFLFEDAMWFSFWDRVMEITVRYGYRPLLATAWLASFMLVGAIVFANTEANGGFKPNDSRVWLSDTWKECVNNTGCFMERPEGKSYPSFNPFIYSVDTLLPFVDLEMQSLWTPDDRAGGWGSAARVYLWLHIAAGWFFSLLAVAGFTGLIKPE